MSKYTSTQKLNAANSSSTAGNNNCFGESAEAATPLSLPAVLDLMPSCPGGAARIKQRRGNDEREKLFGVSIGRKRTRHEGGAGGEDEHAAVVKTEPMDGRPPAAALALAARRGRERKGAVRREK
jgi:heat shock transcription factor